MGIQTIDQLEVTGGKPLRQLLLVSPNLVKELWPHAEKLLQLGKKYWEGFTTIEQIHKRVKDGTLQLWLINDEDEFLMAILTEIVTRPKGSALKIVWIYGTDLSLSLDNAFLDYIELWAMREGCSRVIVEGRKGWTRRLLSHGYFPTRYVVEKDISMMKEH